MGLELKDRLESALNLSLPATILFDYPDIVILSDHLITELFSGHIVVLPSGEALVTNGIPRCDRSQPLPLSYAQQRMWVLAQLEALAAAYQSEASAVAVAEWLRDNCAVDIGPLGTIAPRS